MILVQGRDGLVIVGDSLLKAEHKIENIVQQEIGAACKVLPFSGSSAENLHIRLEKYIQKYGCEWEEEKEKIQITGVLSNIGINTFMNLQRERKLGPGFIRAATQEILDGLTALKRLVENTWGGGIKMGWIPMIPKREESQGEVGTINKINEEVASLLREEGWFVAKGVERWFYMGQNGQEAVSNLTYDGLHLNWVGIQEYSSLIGMLGLEMKYN